MQTVFIDKDGWEYRITGKHHLTGNPIYDIKKPNEKWQSHWYGRSMNWFLTECITR